MPKAFGQHADAQARDATAERRGVLVDAYVVLPRIEPVGPGNHFEQQRVVGHRGGHRPGVVDGCLDRHDAGVRHQAMRRLHAVAPRVRTRHADRAALVAADRHLDFAGAHERRAAARRTPRRIADLVRVVHRPRRRRVAAAREAKVLAVRLADDGAAGVEDARDHRRIDVGHITFERRRAVHHRHAGQTDVVLQHDALAGQRAIGRALHLRLDVPRTERVLAGARPRAGRARVAHFGQVVGQLFDPVIGLHRAFEHVEVLADLALRHAHVQRADDLLQLLDRGSFDHGHGVTSKNGSGFGRPRRGNGRSGYGGRRSRGGADARTRHRRAAARDPRCTHAQQLGEAAGLHCVGVDLALDAAPFDDDDAVGNVEHQVEVLLHHQQRQLVALAQADQDLADLLHDRRLDAFGRFVEQQQPRHRHQRAAEREDLLLAAGQRPALAIEQRAQPRQRVDHALDRAGLDLAGVRAPGQAQVFDRGEARQDASALRHITHAESAALVSLHARDVDAVHRHPAGRRGHQPEQRLQQGGLADAVVTDDAHGLALAQLKIDAMQHRHMAIAGTQARRRRARRRCAPARPAPGRSSARVRHSFRAAPDVDLAHQRVG